MILKDYAKYYETKDDWKKQLKKIQKQIDSSALVLAAIIALTILFFH